MMITLNYMKEGQTLDALGVHYHCSPATITGIVNITLDELVPILGDLTQSSTTFCGYTFNNSTSAKVIVGYTTFKNMKVLWLLEFSIHVQRPHDEFDSRSTYNVQHKCWGVKIAIYVTT